MRRTNLEAMVSVGRHRSVQIFAGFLFLYLLLMSMEIPFVLKDGFGFVGSGELQHGLINNEKEMAGEEINYRVSQKSIRRNPERRMREFEQVSGLVFDEMSPTNSSTENESAQLHKLAREAFRVGKKLWEEISSGKVRIELENKAENLSDSCTHSVVMNGDKFREMGNVVVIPCGLALGSHITVVGKPHFAHPENEPNIALVREDESLMVSQFKVELQGLKTVDGEDPPRILHFNPRLKGDFSGRPVIEQNTCYRMQWGSGLRCEGWRSKADEETVDGQVKCEKWIRDDDVRSEESQTTWWVKRLIGKTSKVTIDWPYPFVEDKLFVLTLSAGLEGFHVNVDGRHATSFPYRIGFTLEDATGLSISDDVDVHSVFAASLPTSHPSFGPQKLLEMSTQWQASPLPHGPVELFIGILSAGNHFAERMAVRKSWMQHPFIKSSNVVVRFFVALHGRNEVNVQLMKEAEFFGDIVTVPYMDHYDLVVLKTIAICEYGVRKLAAKYIMKCDDDTFVRVEAVMWEVKKVHGGPLYVGNINYYHKPLRYGKWAVTYEEWPEEVYPPYANGPGYILSSDIAQYILSEFENHNLRLFKMEDVSMGVWVEQFNNSTRRGAGVEYVHSLNFCQFGCIQDYYTAHYQSPRQMMCLWETLQRTRKPICCDMR